MGKQFVTDKITPAMRQRIVMETITELTSSKKMEFAEAMLYLYLRSKAFEKRIEGKRNPVKDFIPVLAKVFAIENGTVRKRLQKLEKMGLIAPAYIVKSKIGDKTKVKIIIDSYDNIKKNYQDSMKRINIIYDLPGEIERAKSFIKQRNR